MRPVDPRLLRHARAAQKYLIFTVGLGLVVTALVLAQAGLLAHALATAARGTGTAALWPTLAVLLAVVAARAVAAGGGETVALRAAATVKSQLTGLGAVSSYRGHPARPRCHTRARSPGLRAAPTARLSPITAVMASSTPVRHFAAAHSPATPPNGLPFHALPEPEIKSSAGISHDQGDGCRVSPGRQ